MRSRLCMDSMMVVLNVSVVPTDVLGNTHHGFGQAWPGYRRHSELTDIFSPCELTKGKNCRIKRHQFPFSISWFSSFECGTRIQFLAWLQVFELTLFSETSFGDFPNGPVPPGGIASTGRTIPLYLWLGSFWSTFFKKVICTWCQRRETACHSIACIDALAELRRTLVQNAAISSREHNSSQWRG